MLLTSLSNGQARFYFYFYCYLFKDDFDDRYDFDVEDWKKDEEREKESTEALLVGSQLLVIHKSPPYRIG